MRLGFPPSVAFICPFGAIASGAGRSDPALFSCTNKLTQTHSKRKGHKRGKRGHWPSREDDRPTVHRPVARKERKSLTTPGPDSSVPK